MTATAISRCMSSSHGRIRGYLSRWPDLRTWQAGQAWARSGGSPSSTARGRNRLPSHSATTSGVRGARAARWVSPSAKVATHQRLVTGDSSGAVPAASTLLVLAGGRVARGRPWFTVDIAMPFRVIGGDLHRPRRVPPPGPLNFRLCFAVRMGATTRQRPRSALLLVC